MVGRVGLLAVEAGDEDDVRGPGRGLAVHADLHVPELGNALSHSLQRRHGGGDVIGVFEGEHDQVGVHGAG